MKTVILSEDKLKTLINTAIINEMFGGLSDKVERVEDFLNHNFKRARLH